MRNIKVVLVTFGPLHLIKSAEFLSKHVDITVIQGWIPSWWNKWLLKPISKYIGYDLSRTIKKRTPECLSGRNYGIGLADFFGNAARILSWEKGSVMSAKLFGYFSKKYFFNAQILHIRSGSGGGGAIEKAKKCGMKVVVDHSIANPVYMERYLRPEFEKNGFKFNLGISNPFWQMVLDDCKKADCLLVNSSFVKQTFVDDGFDQEKIKVAYLGVRKDFVGLKKTYNIDRTLKILFTGGFGLRKGAEYSLKAMQKLDELNVNYEFIVVGNNSEAKELIEKIPIKNLKAVGMVPQDDLKSYYTSSDIYLFPSLCEGCASSGMEAMAAGLPVIATEESGLPITHEQNGIIIPSKNVDRIVQALMELKDNNHKRKYLGENATHLISTNYSWEQYATNVVDIYNSMLQ